MTKIIDIGHDALYKFQKNPQGVLEMDKFNQLFGEMLIREVIDICQTKIKAFDIQGNEYIVTKNNTTEKCIQSLKEHFGIKNE